MESTGDNEKSNDTKVSEDEESADDFTTFIEEKLEDIDENFDKRRLLRSGVWEYFDVTDIDNKTATCNLCSERFSFRTTSTNLTKHLKRKHCIELDKIEEQVTTKLEDPIKPGGRVSIAWKYFTVKDGERRLGACKLCGAHISYRTSVTNLMKHVQRKHGVDKDSDDDEDGDEGVEENPFEQKDPIKPAGRVSIAWKYFTVKDGVRRLGACKLCGAHISYRTSVTNLMKHVQRKHGVDKDSDDDEDGDEGVEENPFEQSLSEDPIKPGGRVSVAWEYFTVKDRERRVGACKLCGAHISYRTSVSNLMKHVQRKHGVVKSSDDEDGDDVVEEIPFDNGDKKPRINPSVAWKYFTKTDPERRIATCKLCNEDRSYMSTVGNLIKHVRRKHDINPSITPESDDDNVEELELRETSSTKSSVWLYFKLLDKLRKMAMCLLCKKRLSYTTSITNLKRHLHRKHPQVKLTEGGEAKKILISSGGQLYEIEETSTKQEKADDEQPTIDMDTVFLEDFDGDILENNDKPKSKRPRREKRAKHPPEPEHLVQDSESTDSEVLFKKGYIRKRKDSLDKFGSYIISLLRQLPKELSNQLQMDFVKQIMTAQLTYESQKKIPVPVQNTGYAITISEPQDANIEFMTVQEQVVIDGE